MVMCRVNRKFLTIIMRVIHSNLRNEGAVPASPPIPCLLSPYAIPASPIPSTMSCIPGPPLPPFDMPSTHLTSPPLCHAPYSPTGPYFQAHMIAVDSTTVTAPAAAPATAPTGPIIPTVSTGSTAPATAPATADVEYVTIMG